jgi:SOS response regulatory protein OraA/RecX
MKKKEQKEICLDRLKESIVDKLSADVLDDYGRIEEENTYVDEKQYALRYIKNRDKAGLPLRVLGTEQEVAKLVAHFKENEEEILLKDFLGEEACEDEYLKYILWKLNIQYIDFVNACIFFIESARKERETEEKKREQKEKRKEEQSAMRKGY